MTTARPRRICFVTGTRADYGHMFWLMREVAADPQLELQIIATGAHLSPLWGSTVKVIEADGFTIDARVDMQLASDSSLATCKAIGLAVMGLADAYDRLAPDLVVLLGDRYEELAAAQAALVMRIPVAHLHGGETSEGAMDESIRHAVTKMAHLHFVAADSYADRVRQLGENPAHVYGFGAPGLDHLTRGTLATRCELEEFIGLPLTAPLLMVTYHPATLAERAPAESMSELLAALDAFSQARIIFTGVNADPGHDGISQLICDYVARHPDTTRHFLSLGQKRYLGLMRLADAVVGNSSSGLIEAPALRVPTVNLGDRQKGRLKAVSVIDCAEERGAITAAIGRALSAEFRDALPADVSLYGQGNSSARIKQVLKTADLSGLAMKHFFDMEPS